MRGKSCKLVRTWTDYRPFFVRFSFAISQTVSSSRLGPVHIITDCWEPIHELEIARIDSDRFQIGPITLLDKLARHGFHLVAQTSTNLNTQHGGGKKYLYWTCKRDLDSEGAEFKFLTSKCWRARRRYQGCISEQSANPQCSSTDLDGHWTNAYQ